MKLTIVNILFYPTDKEEDRKKNTSLRSLINIDATDARISYT